MKNDTSNLIEQRASKGVTENVDNIVLQMILKMTKEAKLKNDELVVFQLNACPHCEKQSIFLEDVDDDSDMENGICIFAEKQVDTRVVVYQYEPNKQIICLESEAEELMQK